MYNCNTEKCGFFLLIYYRNRAGKCCFITFYSVDIIVKHIVCCIAIFIVWDDSRIILALLGMVGPIDGRTRNEVKVDDDKLEAAQRTCSLLSISLLSITFFPVVASWLQLYAANALGASSTNCLLFSSDVRHFVKQHFVY